jgi:DNA-binding response OmpR family regulator
VAGRTPTAIVVDDEPDVRGILAAIVARNGFEVTEGKDGEEAVRLASERRPDLIFLDVMMPKLTGLEALAQIREANPGVCVVLVSATASQEHAEEALRLGAVNFIQKPFDRREIGFVVQRIRAAIEEESDLQPVFDLLEERKTVLSMGNDPAMIGKVVAFLGRELHLHYPGRDTAATEVKLALYEAIANAIEHGNLGIGFDDKTKAASDPGGVAALVEKRRKEPPFADRKIRLEARYGASEVEYRIRDGGPGFSVKGQEARRQDLTALHGRGLMLIRHYMNRVDWNEAGNEIRLARTVPGRETTGLCAR